MAAPAPELAGVAIAAGPAARAARPPTPWQRLGASFWVAAAWLALITLLAIAVPLLHFADPNLPDLTNRGGPPSAGHPLGTDSLGRDMLSRLIWGARISLTVGYASTLLGMVFGTVLGMAAGYL